MPACKAMRTLNLAMRSNGRIAAAGGTLLFCLVSLLGGCTDPEAAPATAWRQQRARDTVGLLVEREQDGPRRIQNTLDIVAETEQLHNQHLHDTADCLQERWAFEVQRWQDTAEYQRRLNRELQGNWPSAEWAIREMFY